MPAATYQVALDLTRDNTFAHDITPCVRYLEWSNGLDESYAEIAPPARLLLTVDNSDGAFWPEDSGANYFGIITSVLVRVRATFGIVTNQPLYIGKIVSIQPSLGVYGPKHVIITCDDLMPELLTTEYNPALQLNVTVDHALRALFDDAVISYPYARSYWIFGVSGAGELGSKSILFDASGFVNFDTARTTLAFVGDNITPRGYRSTPVGAQGLAPNPLGYALAGASPHPVHDDYPYRRSPTPFPHFLPSPPPQFPLSNTLGDQRKSLWERGLGDQRKSPWEGGVTYDEVNTAHDFLRDMLAAEAGGRFFYDTRTAQFVFHDRSRDIENDTLFAALTDDDLEAADYRYADDVVSHVTIAYQPRTIGLPASVLWTVASVPIRFAPRQERRLTARYQDPLESSARIGGMDFIPLQAGTDYAAFPHPNGTGKNATHYLLASVIFKAAVAELTITNTAPFDVYLTHLQVRGTPLSTAYERQLATAVSGESIRDSDFRRRVIDVGAMSSDDDAAAYAGYYLTRFKDPAGRFAQVSFIANKTAARLTRALSASIGARLSISENASSHQADYILVGEHHSVIPGGEHTHHVTWILKPAVRDTFWMLGTSGKSELGTTTRLAF